MNENEAERQAMSDESYYASQGLDGFGEFWKMVLDDIRAGKIKEIKITGV